MSSGDQVQKKTDTAYLHSISGHVGIERMIKAALENDGTRDMSRQEFNSYQCVPCIESVTKWASMLWCRFRKNHSLKLTHSNISKIVGILSLRNVEYFVLFLDDSTAMSAIYVLKEKSEISNAPKAYKATVENQKNVKM